MASKNIGDFDVSVIYANGMDSKDLKDRIKEAREKRGFTQQQLAYSVSKTRGAVSQWEAGESTPKAARRE